ncbi:hypothetical protein L798_04799 [Zootermopsis nevadensis]|uniref:Uncharacterized protein n=1 Tax=Zootermopsis nevadensis TaxID=136037 RepID=A0A067RD14_ZOONE|nr:hypothetical protein L798_04799 [Zootermopsis nevadensis]
MNAKFKNTTAIIIILNHHEIPRIARGTGKGYECDRFAIIVASHRSKMSTHLKQEINKAN